MSRYPSIGLTGDAVAITGGAQGIGRATAEAFAARGARVVIGDLDLDLAKETAARLAGILDEESAYAAPFVGQRVHDAQPAADDLGVQLIHRRRVADIDPEAWRRSLHAAGRDKELVRGRAGDVRPRPGRSIATSRPNTPV